MSRVFVTRQIPAELAEELARFAGFAPEPGRLEAAAALVTGRGRDIPLRG